MVFTMFKIPSKLSLTFSITTSIVFFLACISGMVIMPKLSEMLINVHDNIGFRNSITDDGRTFVLVLAYIILVFGIVADGLLLTLLLRVRSGLVFTSASISLIQYVSWCCFIVCLLFLGLGIYFQLAFIVAFAVLFLGFCLHVVKHVIEEAAAIKSENDLTV